MLPVDAVQPDGLGVRPEHDGRSREPVEQYRAESQLLERGRWWQTPTGGLPTGRGGGIRGDQCGQSSGLLGIEQSWTSGHRTDRRYRPVAAVQGPLSWKTQSAGRRAASAVMSLIWRGWPSNTVRSGVDVAPGEQAPPGGNLVAGVAGDSEIEAAAPMFPWGRFPVQTRYGDHDPRSRELFASTPGKLRRYSGSFSFGRFMLYSRPIGQFMFS